MQELGATAAECVEVRKMVEALLRWSGRRGTMADREAALVWLREIRSRLVGWGVVETGAQGTRREPRPPLWGNVLGESYMGK